MLEIASPREERVAGANHKTTEKILEFPGSSGDWGKKLTCKEHHWATSVNVRYATAGPDENLGVVQMSLKKQTNGKIAVKQMQMRESRINQILEMVKFMIRRGGITFLKMMTKSHLKISK